MSVNKIANTTTEVRPGFGSKATAADIDSKKRPEPPVITCCTSVLIAVAKNPRTRNISKACTMCDIIIPRTVPTAVASSENIYISVSVANVT